MITMKFGGTSMGGAERIENVANIIKKEVDKNTDIPIVVVSAMSGVTNQLLEASRIATESKNKKKEWKGIIDNLRYNHIEVAEYLIKDEFLHKKADYFINNAASHLTEFLEALSVIQELSPISHDEVVSLGEKLSAYLLQSHLNSRGIKAEYFDLSNIVENKFDEINANFFENVANRLQSEISPILKNGVIPVLTGFFGKIPKGIIGAVGRGYTDFTASLAGSAFHSSEIQIWTDVDGLLSADPRVIKNTRTLEEVSFEEACELAEFGAKVLHPQTIWPAVKKNTPVRIKNTLNLDSNGTLITKTGAKSKFLCKSVACKKNVTAITITSPGMLLAFGFLSRVFDLFKKHNVSINLVSTAEISITVTIDQIEMPQKLIDELSEFCVVDIVKSQAVVCAVGEEITKRKEAFAEIFKAVSDAGVTVKAITASSHKINVSMLIDEEDADKTLIALHDKIFCRK